MKQYLYLLPIIFAVALVLFVVPRNKPPEQEATIPVDQTTEEQTPAEEETTSMANPASEYCVDNEGELEIITNSDGSQFGLCKLGDYTCEEWTYFRNECDVKGDSEKIKQALIAKGLDLNDMKVVINKHLGKYIAGGVVPVSAPGGGGYVFAAKDDAGSIKIVADGNGAIMCTMLEDYPDFPTYLIPECIDETGNPITR